MSFPTETPFPEEQEAQGERPMVNPWEGDAPQGFWGYTHFDADSHYLGPAWTAIQGIGSAVGKGEAVLYGAEKSLYQDFGNAAETLGVPHDAAQYLAAGAEQNVQASQELVRRSTPDPRSTSGAMQMLHSVVEGGTLMLGGAAFGGIPGAAVAMGAAQGVSRTQELREQGVDESTAVAGGLLAGAENAAGAAIPGALGKTLVTRVATGALGMAGFQLAGNASDHLLLEAAGYHEMADQQKIWDGTQLLAMLALGALGGGFHHWTAPEEAAVERLRSPENRDAALTVNLSTHDRQAAPGVPADPETANLGTTALNKAVEDLEAGKLRADISDVPLERGEWVKRPEADLNPARQVFVESLKESGLLDEEANLRDLERSLEGRLSEPKRTAPQVPLEEREAPPTDPVEAALAERPDLKIANEQGEPIQAAGALERADENTKTAASEIPKAVEAAIACFQRRGG